MLPWCETTGIQNKPRESLTLQRNCVHTSLFCYQPRRQRMKEMSLFKACIQSQKLEIWQTCTFTSQGSTQPIGNIWLTQKVGQLFTRIFLFDVWSVMLCPKDEYAGFLNIVSRSLVHSFLAPRGNTVHAEPKPMLYLEVSYSPMLGY